MPTGWNISVYRQPDNRIVPAMFGDEPGDRLAVWQARLEGLNWLTRLVDEGHAVNLGGNGYPTDFTARAGDVLPHLVGEPPEANPIWFRDEGDIVLPGWPGSTTKAADVISACQPDEWLLIRVWDES